MANVCSLKRQRVACVWVVGGGSHEQALKALAEACLRLSPQVAVRENEAIFIEIGKSRALFSEATIEARLKVLAARVLRTPVRIAIADTAASALAAAKYPNYARTRDLHQLPLEALTDYGSPFCHQVDDEKQMTRLRSALKALGVLNVGAFACLPRASLASRFGRTALAVMASVHGEFSPAWPGFYPTPRVIERSEVCDPEAHGLCVDLEGVVFVLKQVVDKAMARLRGRLERVSVLELRFGPEKRQWRIELPLPQGSTTLLMPILRERLAFELARTPLLCPIEKIELEVLETVPGMGQQRDFFSKKEQEQEVWDGLVARLSQKLGKDRVFVALPEQRYLPESAYSRKLMPETDVLVPEVRGSDRPTRILKQPEPLDSQDRCLNASDGRRWKVLSWQGPERISGEWWKSAENSGFCRDYYRVVAESGEHLWVYVDHASLYLHGYFD
ncbi:hypothetical protein WDW37_06065 [Bdellovibrionota bacterium FG-1]